MFVTDTTTCCFVAHGRSMRLYIFFVQLSICSDSFILHKYRAGGMKQTNQGRASSRQSLRGKNYSERNNLFREVCEREQNTEKRVCENNTNKMLVEVCENNTNRILTEVCENNTNK